jgi:D-cysteine desulfhydrase
VNRREGLLEALVPGLAPAAPRLLIATLPTPVTALPALAASLGLAELSVKRDDATSPLYGGTKLRGLEFFFGRALSEGRRCVVTAGSAGSNHVVATATFAQKAGLGMRAVLFPHPDAAYAETNVARARGLGADARAVGWGRFLPALARARLQPAGGARPLWIAPGGSSALGVLGAAEGALEVVRAVEDGLLAMPEDVVVAAGSCGTAAGLALGFALARAPVRVVAVRVVPRIVASRGRVLRLAGEALALLRNAGLAPPVALGEVGFVHDQAGGGYARPTPAAHEGVNIAHAAGIRAETTYTGKAWAHVLTGALQGRRVLFWNTFGG